MAARLDSVNMNALTSRAAMSTGLVFAAVIALWWLASTRIALDRGGDGAGTAAAALHALLLIRGMALALSSVRIGALRDAREALWSGAALVAPSWPVVLLLWSASTLSAWQVVCGEALLLVGAAVFTMIGAGVRRVLGRTPLAFGVVTAAALASVSAVWLSRALVVVVLS